MCRLAPGCSSEGRKSRRLVASLGPTGPGCCRGRKLPLLNVPHSQRQRRKQVQQQVQEFSSAPAQIWGQAERTGVREPHTCAAGQPSHRSDGSHSTPVPLCLLVCKTVASPNAQMAPQRRRGCPAPEANQGPRPKRIVSLLRHCSKMTPTLHLHVCCSRPLA